MLISSLYVTIQLLSGRLPEDEGSSEAEEDQIPFEGSNAKEQVVSGFTPKKLDRRSCSSYHFKVGVNHGIFHVYHF